MRRPPLSVQPSERWRAAERRRGIRRDHRKPGRQETVTASSCRKRLVDAGPPGYRRPRSRWNRPSVPARARPDGGGGRDSAGRSSALGAHREAAAQFERAFRCAAEADLLVLAQLQEGVADEYALLDRWPETEAALREALARRRELGDDLMAGRDLRVLSTALWRLCRGRECELAANEAVSILESVPPGQELSRAYSRLGVAILCSGRQDDGLELIARARDLGAQLHQPDVVSYALNAIGLTLVDDLQDGMPTLGW
jgi:hypothetical protein